MDDRLKDVMPAKIAMGLVKATRAAHAVEKKGTVKTTSYSYKFAGADALMSEAREALAEGGLAIVLTRWWPAIEKSEGVGEDGKAWSAFDRTIFAEFLLVHEEGDSHALGPYQMPVLEERGRGLDKADASALTYATGYVMRGVLNLPRVEPGSQVDERDDTGRDGRVKREPKPEPTAEEKRAKVVNAIENSIASVPGEEHGSLQTWVEEKYAKAVKALAPDPAGDLNRMLTAAAQRLGDSPVDVSAWIKTATEKAAR